MVANSGINHATRSEMYSINMDGVVAQTMDKVRSKAFIEVSQDENEIVSA